MSNASTLVYHMRRIAERAGVRWDSDCEEEVHDVVKDIERQIEKVREEVRELRALVPGMTERGITKREYFAAMAMQGLAPHYAQGGDAMAAMATHVAKLAVENADALLAELERHRAN